MDRLIEGEDADLQVVFALLQAVADLLRVLVLLAGVLAQRGDRQAGVVAVVRRVPVPEAPGGDAGQRARAQLRLDAQRDAAGLVLGEQGLSRSVSRS
jgi:hypothetical protein